MNKQEFFFQSFLLLETPSEVESYLRDLLTVQEIAEFTERLAVADMLNSGMTYVEIGTKTSMSSTTIARISKWLKGSNNGYRLVLSRLHHLSSSLSHP